jgi:hypothetical protein
VSTINLVSGDTRPSVELTLTREDTGAAIDLSSATVRMKFRKKGSDTLLLTKTSTASSEDAEQGKALFEWSSGDLDIAAGAYEGEVSFTVGTNTETVLELLNFNLRDDF